MAYDDWDDRNRGYSGPPRGQGNDRDDWRGRNWDGNRESRAGGRERSYADSEPDRYGGRGREPSGYDDSGRREEHGSYGRDPDWHRGMGGDWDRGRNGDRDWDRGDMGRRDFGERDRERRDRAYEHPGFDRTSHLQRFREQQRFGDRGDDRPGERGRFDDSWRPQDRGMREHGGMPPGPDYTGRGPRSYQRSDERIREDINETLTRHWGIDASDIEVKVQGGEVTLSGVVDTRTMRRLAEEIIENLPGVRDVRNELRVPSQDHRMHGDSAEPGKSGGGQSNGIHANVV